MTFQDRVKIMFNFALFPEVTDVFVQDESVKDTRFVSVEISVNGNTRVINSEFDPETSANSIIRHLEPRVRLRIEEMEAEKSERYNIQTA